MKPNRNYFKNISRVYYEYVAFDYLNKMFAVSLLEDKDQNDNVVQQSEIEANLQVQEQVEFQQENN